MSEILEKSKQEWDDQYKSYPSVTPEGFEPRHESRIAPIAYEIPLGAEVLDVGANDGSFMKLLTEKRDCTVIGIDVSDEAIAKAKEKGLEVLKLDICEGLPFADETFDIVTLNEVLVHLTDPAKGLKEIRRVLKKDGYLLGSTPHKNLERFIWDDKRMHHRYFDETELRDLLEKEFPMTHLRILSGAQFAAAFAQSFLSKEAAEILFKCGGSETQDWGQTLVEDTTLKVWFGYTQGPGTIYYRMLGYAEKMEEAGLLQAAYERAPWNQINERSGRWQQRIRNKVVLNHLDQILRVADVSIWQIVMNRDVLAFLRCAKDLAEGPWYVATGQKKAFVTEIDDNLFDVPPYNIASHPYQPSSEMEWVAMEQLKLSDALICSTQFLVDRMCILFPEKDTYLIPNSIDFEVWDHLTPFPDIPKKEPGQIRIGYTGCANHRGDLESIKEPMCAILQEFPNVQFFMTPQPDPAGMWLGWQGFKNLFVVSTWVEINKFPAFIAGWDMDIGIAPLKDNDFNRAKSNLRWLEYSALKVPTVASRVYPFKNSISHGKDGLIANSNREWYDAMKTLILDVGKRKELGQAAYDRVKADFNMDLIAKKYADVLHSIHHAKIGP